MLISLIINYFRFSFNTDFFFCLVLSSYNIYIYKIIIIINII